MAVETTLVLVKPDGVRRGLCGEIVARFERRGYELRGARLLKVSGPLAREHYAEHRGKPFFSELVGFITSGPVLALAVRGENAIAGVRALMGATNPADSAPGTIRGDLATLLSENVVHGSDSRASARRELKLFFPDGLGWWGNRMVPPPAPSFCVAHSEPGLASRPAEPTSGRR